MAMKEDGDDASQGRRLKRRKNEATEGRREQEQEHKKEAEGGREGINLRGRLGGGGAG